MNAIFGARSFRSVNVDLIASLNNFSYRIYNVVKLTDLIIRVAD